MKNLLLPIIALLFTIDSYGQQLPLSENYFVDRYSLSSAYAGNSENKNLVLSYRRDWSGIDNAPRTLRIGYHDGFKTNAGLGARIILDKFGIFQSFYGMATYSYRLKLAENQHLFFALSAGIHQNTINFSRFYNDPGFTSDPAMINKDVKSAIRLVSDFSVVYTYGSFHAGLLLSDVSYSDAKYSNVQVKYSPFIHYQLHTSYTIPVNDTWEITPMAIVRGGKNVPLLIEVASQFKYKNRIWSNIGHRGKDLICVGFGADAGKGILLNYSYNLFTGVTVSGFQNHELTIGLRLSDFLRKKEVPAEEKQPVDNL